jgi:PAS domain-containing protein
MKWSIGRIIRASKMENANAQERAEEELREQWLWFEVTLSSIGDGVIATDTNGSINFLNPALNL